MRYIMAGRVILRLALPFFQRFPCQMGVSACFRSETAGATRWETRVLVEVSAPLRVVVSYRGKLRREQVNHGCGSMAVGPARCDWSLDTAYLSRVESTLPGLGLHAASELRLMPRATPSML